MDIRTGEIIGIEEVKSLNDLAGRNVTIPIKTELTAKQLRLKKIGKNDPCGCGSKKKFKYCCFENSKARRVKARLPLQHARLQRINEERKAQCLEDVKIIAKNFTVDK
jgi:hypothetical protein